MDARIFTEPQQGASYDQLLDVALCAERNGFSAFFRSDHYLSFGGSGLPGPTDAWITLAGLARDTTSIRLGTLVSPVTFRYPGPLAISVAQVDQMSGGRVELGLGTGWFDGEHDAYAIPFPALGERFDMLEEQLQIVRGLWDTPIGETYSFKGERYSVLDSPALPKPTQERLPIIVGGGGATRTPRLTAEYAEEFNMPFPRLEAYRAQVARVRAACEQTGRDPDHLTYSVALTVCCGESEQQVEHRAERIGQQPAVLRESGLAGLPEEVVETAQAYADAGAERIYFQVLDLGDLDHIDLIARDIVPHI